MLSLLIEIVLKFSSFFFVLQYLLVLLALAFFKHISTRNSGSDSLPKLSRKDRKLVRDTGYYVELAGYRWEPYRVVTSDGFVLDMGRIRGKDTTGYPVLLIPGLMQSSTAYLTSGPDSIAFDLVRAGFDVWLGNNRGGFKGEHAEFNRFFTNKMWQWNMTDLARYDVPKMLDTVLENSHYPKCAVIGHSQGTAQTFLALSSSMLPELSSKISSFSALAPAVYAGPLIDRWYLKVLRKGTTAWHAMMGYGPFLGPMFSLEKLLPLKISSEFGYAMFNYLLGWNDHLWDRRYRDRCFVFAPVYVSSKHMGWWLGKGGFADTKCLFDESKHQWFDKTFPKLQLFVCGNDELCNGERLVNRIKTLEPISAEVVDLPSYAHLDVLWAKDVHIQVTPPLIQFIEHTSVGHTNNSAAATSSGIRVSSNTATSRPSTPGIGEISAPMTPVTPDTPGYPEKPLMAAQA